MEEQSKTMEARVSEQLDDGALDMDMIDELLVPEDEALSKGSAKKKTPAEPKSAKSGRARVRSKPIVLPQDRYKQLSFYVSKDEYLALRQASVDREGKGEEPYGHEKMARTALRNYLMSLGFGPEDARADG